MVEQNIIHILAGLNTFLLGCVAYFGKKGLSKLDIVEKEQIVLNAKGPIVREDNCVLRHKSTDSILSKIFYQNEDTVKCLLEVKQRLSKIEGSMNV